MTDAQYKECTTKVKALADIRPIMIDDADSIIRAFHHNVTTGSDKPLLGNLSASEQAAVDAKEQELRDQPEKKELDSLVKKQAIAA